MKKLNKHLRKSPRFDGVEILRKAPNIVIVWSYGKNPDLYFTRDIVKLLRNIDLSNY